MSGSVRARKGPDPGRRGFWLKHLHRWHWISAALSLIGMILFAATGITLNHAAQIEARPVVTTTRAELPADLLPTLTTPQRKGKAPLPAPVRDWIVREMRLTPGAHDAEWSSDEVYLALPRAGGDAWLTVDLESGAILHEKTDRGWISYLNDLHKGRNAGAAWSWFLDVFAVACLVFCITGLCLLTFHAGKRPATWPVVGLGLVVPLLLAILFIH